METQARIDRGGGECMSVYTCVQNRDRLKMTEGANENEKGREGV